MRRRAGERPVLHAVQGKVDGVGADHIASVTRRDEVLARLCARTTEDDRLGYIAARVADHLVVIEHRQADPHETPSGRGSGASPGPGALLRLIDVETRDVLARAESRVSARSEQWTLYLAEDYRLEFIASLRHRPRRLLLRDHDRDTGWGLEVCRAPSGWAFHHPPDLQLPSILLPLWLAHLLDTGHVLRARPWRAPQGWQVMLDETGRLAPGGFTAHFTGGGGFSGPATGC